MWGEALGNLPLLFRVQHRTPYGYIYFCAPIPKKWWNGSPSREQAAVCVVLGRSIAGNGKRFQVQLCVRAGFEIYLGLFFVGLFPLLLLLSWGWMMRAKW